MTSTHSIKASIQRHSGPVAVLVLAACAVFGQLVGHEFMYNWDDEYYVLKNEAIQGFSWGNVRTVFSQYYVGNYAPVQMLSYMLDFSLWGFWPGGYCFSNLLLHLGNGLLIYILLFHWYRDRLIALCAAALFLLHPVQVETVAWVSQRKTLLSMFFFLLAWLGYCYSRQVAKGVATTVYGLSVAAYVLSLLAKSVAVIFPVVLLMYEHCFSPGGRRAGWKTLIPFILASGAVTAVSIYSQQPVDGGWMGQGGGAVPYHGGSPLATFFTMLPVFCRYLGMLFWPADLSLFYYPAIHRSVDGQVIAAAILLMSITWSGVVLYKIDRRLGFWVLLFWLGLLPVAQIVPLATLMNDRYLYFPMIGAAALYGIGMAFIRDRLRMARHKLLYIVLFLPLLVLGIVSFQRAAVWQNPVAAWGDTVAKTPNAEFTLHKLAEAYQFANPPQLQEALDAYVRVTAMNPAAFIAWYQLGNIYSLFGDYEKSIGALRMLLTLKPDHVMGIAALGHSFQLQGSYAEAESEYRRALTLQPDAIPVVSMLGSLALARGDLDLARATYLRVETAWQDADSAFQLACIEVLAGRNEASFAWLEKALQRGYGDWDKLRTVKELAAIRGTERFSVLMRHYGGQKVLQ